MSLLTGDNNHGLMVWEPISRADGKGADDVGSQGLPSLSFQFQFPNG